MEYSAVFSLFSGLVVFALVVSFVCVRCGGGFHLVFLLCHLEAPPHLGTILLKGREMCKDYVSLLIV